MEIFIHIGTNLEYFDLLNEGYLLSLSKKDREIAHFFVENFPGELATSISPQYETNFLAIREIKKAFGVDAFNKIGGIYYGSDNCEFLVPTLPEIKLALEKFNEFNKKYPPHRVRSFTLVTPYVGDEMLSRLEGVLEYLNTLKTKHSIEVVVNDFGVLSLIHEKYKNLSPIFGRLLHKLLKTPLIDTYGYDVHPAGELIKNKSEIEIQKLKEEIIKWQVKFYSSSEVSLSQYRDFLKRYNVGRVTLDFMTHREALYDNSRYDSIGIDVYYPWALVFTGRLCDTSAIENPIRGLYASDSICPRTCDRYDIFYNIKTEGYNMIQRGNAGYRSELSLDYLPLQFRSNLSNRLVFAPFIPI